MSVSLAVHEYIDQHPVLRDAYAMGIVNYSALARLIVSELDGPSIEAVLSACRRYKPGLARSQVATVERALETSRLEVRNRVGLLQFPTGWGRLARLAQAIDTMDVNAERVHLLHGWEHIQLVAPEEFLDELTPILRQELPVEERRGLVELNIKSPREIENVPGFIAALTNALAQRGIRIVDATTCGDDHLLLIEEEDMAQAVQQLDLLLQPKQREADLAA